MKLPISQRLLSLCDYIAPGARVADVGCDHGYLAIHLVQTGLASLVYASDIRPAPLDSARKNGEKYGVSEKIAYFLSDGVQSIPRDFDTLVCAGMGADVMISILEASPWLQNEHYKLVLQCQSKTPMLRKYLSKTGWAIRREHVLKDGRFLYTIMEAVWSPGTALTPGECFLSPALKKAKDPLLPDYVRWVTDHLGLSVHNQPGLSQWEKDAYQELLEVSI